MTWWVSTWTIGTGSHSTLTGTHITWPWLATASITACNWLQGGLLRTLPRLVSEQGLQRVQGGVCGHHDTAGAICLVPDMMLLWGPPAVRQKDTGLFKTEWHGDAMAALCSKSYYYWASEGWDKLSSKGVQKGPMQTVTGSPGLLKRPDQTTLGPGINCGIRTSPGGMFIHCQERAALSSFYIKRHVLDNGIHMEPLSLWEPHTCTLWSWPLPTTAAAIEYEAHDLQLQWHADGQLFGKSVLTTWLVAQSLHIIIWAPPKSCSSTATCNQPTEIWPTRLVPHAAAGSGAALHLGTVHGAWDSCHRGQHADH